MIRTQRPAPHQRRYRAAPVVAGTSALALIMTACGGGSGFDDDQDDGDDGGTLDILIASSGDSETDSVKDAVSDWSDDSGVDADVNNASDLPQELSQGFSSDSPPDLFYMSDEDFVDYAANGLLDAYAGDLEEPDDFYDVLHDTFTYDNDFYCAPKDFSTLALFINEDAWSDAGLSDDDIPTDWEEFDDVASALTDDDQAGVTFDPEWQRLGAFMAQAGGGLVSDDESTATVDSEKNVEALTYVQDLLSSGAAQYPGGLDAGWGGEAFGKENAAMAIEGNWLVGAMSSDFPDVDYQIVPLPEGPDGAGTMEFTNCWGIPADGSMNDEAVDLIEDLTSVDQQLEFAEDFGVMPSRESASDDWSDEFPEQQAFLDGADDAQGVPPVEGVSDVIDDLNSHLENLQDSDPQDLLSSVQSTMEGQLD